MRLGWITGTVLVIVGIPSLSGCGWFVVAPPPRSPTPGVTIKSPRNGIAGPSSSSSQPHAPRCRISQLRVALHHSGAAAGTVGAYITVTNTSLATCSIKGWPVVAGITASGRSDRATDYSALLGEPHVSGVPEVILNPSETALAVVAAHDNPPQGEKRCPPAYKKLRIALPGSTDSIVVSAWLPALGAYVPSCAGLGVTMFAPASAFGNP